MTTQPTEEEAEANPPRVLFLDDDPVRHRRFEKDSIGKGLAVTYVWTAAEAIRVLTEAPEPFDVAHLDHDLGGETFVEREEGSGTEVARAIAAMPAARRPARVYLHSYNPAGARRQAAILLDAGVWHRMRPFGLW